MREHLGKIDWVLGASAVTLVLFGLLSIYGSSSEELINFKKQILWVAIGFFCMFAISFFDYRILKNHPAPSIILYGAATLLLVGVFVFGVSLRGSESWYRIGFITIEPVEFIKIALIILFAKYFSMRHIEMYRLRHVLVSGFYLFLPTVVIFLQSEVGSALVMGSIWIGIMVIAGIKIKQLVGLTVVGLITFFLAWNFIFHDYQKDRFLTFVNPGSDPQGAGYNVRQSTIAIGSAGVWGKGIGQGTQTQLGFLPERQTDFIYAAIAEELGLSGVALLLVSFLFFFRHVMGILRASANNFARLMTAGFLVMVLSQTFINMGMNLGLLPIAGISLPFVSYGGSGMISLFVMLGILQSIRVNA